MYTPYHFIIEITIRRVMTTQDLKQPYNFQKLIREGGTRTRVTANINFNLI